jgi:hypothetical protein
MLTFTPEARKLRYLASGEIRAMAELTFNPRSLERMWDYWATRAGYDAGEAARRRHRE